MKPNRPPKIDKLVREEINKSLDTWLQPGCGSRDDIIDAFDEKWEKVSGKIRSHSSPYRLYKFQSFVPEEVKNTIQRSKDLGWWKELTDDLIKSHINEVDTELANKIITQALTRWMRVDMQLWFPYAWENIKDKKILDALNELSFDYGLGRTELSQIIVMIERYQKWVQELLEDYISSGLIEYNKKETREAIADEVLLEFQNFLEGEMGFLINSKRDEEDCKTIILKFFKTWLVMDKRMWTGVKLEQVLMVNSDKGELVFIDTLSGQDHSEVKVR